MWSKKTPDEMVQSYEKAITEDYIGLWEIVGDAKTFLIADPSTTVRERTIDLVRRMLLRGFRPGDLVEAGGFEGWPEQDTESIIHLIEQEWDQLGREPTINDICWFNRD